MYPTEKQISSFRKYFFEYAIFALGGAICTLFYLYLNLTAYVRVTLTQQLIDSQKIIEKNNEILNQTNFYLNQKPRKNEND